MQKLSAGKFHFEPPSTSHHSITSSARASSVGDKSCGRSGSSQIALRRIELYTWLKQARAWDKVCFQTDAVGVLEQHRIVTRCPCPLLRAVDYGGPHLSK